MAEPTPNPQQQQRLRPHPQTRFDAPQIEVDLAAIISRLRAERGAGEGGRRQETLFRQDGLTIALFAFDRFSHLPEHKTKGLVSIHVLRGRLKITADGQVHELRGGQMLVLAPDVPHAVAAEEESEMLVTIHLTKE
jgi:quercetin dioxygenase-like cupin family protein